MSQALLIRRMGVRPKLEEIEVMEQDPPPLSEIKTGYTPTTTATASDIAQDFSRYENLDTPTPIKSTDLMAYTRFDPHASPPTAAVNQMAATDIQLGPQRQGSFDPPHSSLQPLARDPYAPVETHRLQCYPQPTQGQIAPARASYPQATDYMESGSVNPYYLQCSFSLPSIGVSGATPQPVSQTDTPLPPSSVSTFTPVYTPLQPMRLGTHTSFDQPSSSSARFDVLVNRRSVSVPQTLSCCEVSPFTGGSRTHASATVAGQAVTPSYTYVKPEPFDFPTEIRRSSCSSLTLRPRRSLPTPSASTLSKEKQFVCNAEGCEKRFARVDELKRHQRTHSDIRPYTCNICDKGFTRSDHLITHRRTHTGEKPYPCQYCDRCFARSDERSRHVKTHTNPRSSTSARGRRPSTKYQQRKPLTPQQSAQSCAPQAQASFQQVEMSGGSSDTSHSQSESYGAYQPPAPPQPPPPQ